MWRADWTSSCCGRPSIRRLWFLSLHVHVCVMNSSPTQKGKKKKPVWRRWSTCSKQVSRMVSCMVFLDFSKVYDRLSRPWVLDCMSLAHALANGSASCSRTPQLNGPVTQKKKKKKQLNGNAGLHSLSWAANLDCAVVRGLVGRAWACSSSLWMNFRMS